MIVNDDASDAASPTAAPFESLPVRVRVTSSPGVYDVLSKAAVRVETIADPTFTVAVVETSPVAVSLIVRTTAPNFDATAVTSTTAVPAFASEADDVVSVKFAIVAVVPEVTVIPTDGTTTLAASYAMTSSAPVAVVPDATFFFTVALNDATGP